MPQTRTAANSKTSGPRAPSRTRSRRHAEAGSSAATSAPVRAPPRPPRGPPGGGGRRGALWARGPPRSPPGGGGLGAPPRVGRDAARRVGRPEHPRDRHLEDVALLQQLQLVEEVARPAVLRVG